VRSGFSVFEHPNNLIIYHITLQASFGGFGRQTQLIFSGQLSQGAIWNFIEHFEADLGSYIACARIAYPRQATPPLFCLSLVVRIDYLTISKEISSHTIASRVSHLMTIQGVPDVAVVSDR
jgi:hypothetical protein